MGSADRSDTVYSVYEGTAQLKQKNNARLLRNYGGQVHIKYIFGLNLVLKNGSKNLVNKNGSNKNKY